MARLTVASVLLDAVEGECGAMTEFTRTATELTQIEEHLALAEGAIAAGDNKSLLTLEPAFKKLQEELRGSIAERMDRFQKRCTELDPVTNQPRYGEQMRKKVEVLLQQWAAVLERSSTVAAALELALQEADALSQAEKQEQMRRAEAEKEKAALEEKEAEKRAQAAKEEAARKAALEEEEARILSEEAEKARVAKALRAAAEAEAAEQASARQREEDEALVASVTPGIPGVEAGLEALKQACEDPKVYRDSCDALHLYVHNVIARPEDLTFRRLKNDNPNFKTKVGRFPGGVQCLIAAGFRPQRDDAGALTYVIEEPDFEKDNKGWTDWYDRTKAVRDRLLEESKRAKRR